MKNKMKLKVMSIALALVPLVASAADTADQTAIRQAMMATWDKPDARLAVDLTVVVADRSVAGWTQGDRGGRALLARAHGQWHVVACAGDGLREAKTLEMTGVPPAQARELTTALRAAEAGLPASVRAKFSTFDGMVRMDGGKHP